MLAQIPAQAPSASSAHPNPAPLSPQPTPPFPNKRSQHPGNCLAFQTCATPRKRHQNPERFSFLYFHPRRPSDSNHKIDQTIASAVASTAESSSSANYFYHMTSRTDPPISHYHGTSLLGRLAPSPRQKIPHHDTPFFISSSSSPDSGPSFGVSLCLAAEETPLGCAICLGDLTLVLSQELSPFVHSPRTREVRATVRPADHVGATRRVLTFKQRK